MIVQKRRWMELNEILEWFRLFSCFKVFLQRLCMKTAITQDIVMVRKLLRKVG